MNANSFGKYFGFTTFGESHGPAIGVVIDDVLPNIDFPYEDIQTLLDKRKPANSKFSSSRKESDNIQVLSGVFEGKTTGMPICILIQNEDARSIDYESWKNLFRPGHADYAFFQKYKIYDYRGGGRSSGRETVARVAASGLVSHMLKDVSLTSRMIRIGTIEATSNATYRDNPLYWAEEGSLEKVEAYLESIRNAGNSVGAVVEIKIDHVPVGLGDPVFEKLDANIAKAILSIGGVKGIEFGDGFLLGTMTGDQSNDPIREKSFESNHMGGVLGGISTGQPLVFRYVVKPTPSISIPQSTIDRNGNPAKIELKGRFDVCIAPRVIPVAEAMVKLVLADAIAHQKLLQNEEVDLASLRESIDKIDEDILLAVYRRFSVVKKVREFKKQHGISINDWDREAEIFERLIGIGKEWGIGAEKITMIWNSLIEAGKKE